MKIVHFSDSHGTLGDMSPADLYVVTGDILPNFPIVTTSRGTWEPNVREIGLDERPSPGGRYIGRTIDVGREVEFQNRWIDRQLGRGTLRRHLGSPSAKVVVVRGNHDFVNISRAFGQPVWEVNEDPARIFDFRGHLIGGVRGINRIEGEWSDELTDIEWLERVRSLSTNLDILISHAPPRTILDRFDSTSYGSDALSSYIAQRMLRSENGEKSLRAHFFGHIHESYGHTTVGGVLFSNAATTSNSFNLKRKT